MKKYYAWKSLKCEINITFFHLKHLYTVCFQSFLLPVFPLVQLYSISTHSRLGYQSINFNSMLPWCYTNVDKITSLCTAHPR